MSIDYVFRASPDLGPGITEVIDRPAHYDVLSADGPSYQVGTQVTGSDGAEYWFVKASADIDATADTGTQVTLTFPAYTVATGSGGFYTPPGQAITAGQFFHVRKGAWNAAPG
jgi:type 1 fimbria pilin